MLDQLPPDVLRRVLAMCCSDIIRESLDVSTATPPAADGDGDGVSAHTHTNARSVCLPLLPEHLIGS